ncbi:DUF309 domain-containing protein [Bacillus sp. FJAT-49711]|uniref:DUF309 domain-containing protein n=1 Tax=Bacillus sp. FJAT-49711 TaxID=2833585 RepID=UPI001BC91D2D|nr:DUF309 domain-containing protein [Bacillus sp. FJAT-49711]MBS4217260.1 DUF309 domain-containing protein [Bacillus sp. FJAT-49711]
MPFSKAYVAFLFHFHSDRDYFECHEVLEDHWKNNGMARDSIWVGLIQMAVSFYHYRRGNIKGSVKLIDKAIRLLSYKEEEVLALGINYEELIGKLNRSKVRMVHKMPYKPINIPINNQLLLTICKKQSAIQGYTFENLIDEAPDKIVNKHTLRKKQIVVPEKNFALI